MKAIDFCDTKNHVRLSMSIYVYQIEYIFSRRHQHYHSQRSTRTVDLNSHHQRPSSTYYEYETLQYGGIGGYNPNITIATSTFNHGHAMNGSQRRTSGGGGSGSGHPMPYKVRSPNTPNNHNSSIRSRSRGPFVTQVTIREPIVSSLGHTSPSTTNIVTSASKV